MPVKTVKHGKHEHSVKTVNEEYLGIMMDDRGTERISESFGWSDEQFTKCFEKMSAFQDLQNAIDNLDDDLPRSTKTSTFLDFIKSNSFKKLGIKLDRPNDYLMLGFIFGSSLIKRGLQEDMPQMMGGSSPEKLVEIIAKLKRLIEERV